MKERTYEQIMKEIDTVNRVMKERDIKNVVWSMRIKPWDKIAYKGKFRLFDPCADGDGSVDLTNPTWMDIWKAADKLVLLNQDLHHIFLEFVRKSGTEIKVFLGS